VEARESAWIKPASITRTMLRGTTDTAAGVR
jgi:hypothetical protein